MGGFGLCGLCGFVGLWDVCWLVGVWLEDVGGGDRVGGRVVEM